MAGKTRQKQIFEDVEILGDATLQGVDLVGDQNIAGDLVVTGDVQGDTLTIATDGTVGGDLDVTGDASADNLAVTTDATVGGDLDVTGAASCDDLAAGGDADVAGDLSFGSGAGNSQLASLKVLTENMVIADAASSDSVIQIPAGAVVMGVTARVTTVIPTAATFDIGVAGFTDRYGDDVLVAAGTTNVGPGPHGYDAAVSITITPDVQPAAATGRVRIAIWYMEFTPASA